MDLTVKFDKDIEQTEVIALYKANDWSSAEKPEKLLPALLNSDSLVTARVGSRLIGIGNAISDGHLVVYYPHMLVHPEFHGQGVGRKIMALMQTKYHSFHQQMLTADGEAVNFYKSLGFERAGNTEPMWVYSGTDH
ncbi:GNAT family N-acetyltransferase [Photobacterium lutimaris]|uniref:GNAT family N-acetyltransferase n=1 Tax=Photobacterium lutimaris TaxID=388278 RepID=A0A2T3J4V9_9GAMM|nr:GNAT family N-acetyltransferase [Photobacterium lutimaris]PSU36338.1 GNAT family N-acetyltransferase [Photobacterium lutimaris]TDR74768.1 acetyltransferase (GNAT) family protein [Photobacterium lutimaris]